MAREGNPKFSIKDSSRKTARTSIKLMTLTDFVKKDHLQFDKECSEAEKDSICQEIIQRLTDVAKNCFFELLVTMNRSVFLDPEMEPAIYLKVKRQLDNRSMKFEDFLWRFMPIIPTIMKDFMFDE